MSARMEWASAVSETMDTRRAALEAASEVAGRLGGRPPDLAFVFFSPHHRADPGAIVAALAETLLARSTVGCSAGGVIGAGREIERRPGLSVTAARLPGVSVRTLDFDNGELPDEDASPRAWHEALGVPPTPTPHFVLLADPFSFRSDALLRGLDYAYPQSAKVGGLASAAERPGQNALVVGGEIRRQGCVGVALEGALAVDTVVAQGCRPIGSAMRITRAQAHHLVEVDGRTPVAVLAELLPTLPERDQMLAQSSLFLGIGTDPTLEKPRPGEFLIRNILGVNLERGTIAVGEFLRVGQTVQFHLRDALSSAEDLDALLARYARESAPGDGGSRAAGALLFSCLGRGVNLYGRADHDTDLFRERVGEVPLGGFFCQGEIGSVRGHTYLHGFTSSFALFRPVT